VDPSTLIWARKSWTNRAIGSTGWCRPLRWRDNIVPGPLSRSRLPAGLCLWGERRAIPRRCPRAPRRSAGWRPTGVLVRVWILAGAASWGAVQTNSSNGDAVCSASSRARWRWRGSRHVPSRITDDHRFGRVALGIAEVGDAQVTAGRQPLLRTTSCAQARSCRSGVLKSKKSVTTGFFVLYALSPTRTTMPEWVSRISAATFPALANNAAAPPVVTDISTMPRSCAPGDRPDSGPRTLSPGAMSPPYRS
jgi:hypothetical protein